MSTASKKARLKEQRERGKCEIDDFCHSHNLQFEFITEYQIRIDGKVDVFPTNKRFYNLQNSRWGWYNRVEELLELLKN
jgi:hypothetical protein